MAAELDADGGLGLPGGGLEEEDRSLVETGDLEADVWLVEIGGLVADEGLEGGGLVEEADGSILETDGGLVE